MDTALTKRSLFLVLALAICGAVGCGGRAPKRNALGPSDPPSSDASSPNQSPEPGAGGPDTTPTAPCPVDAAAIGEWVDITPTGVDLFNGDLGINAFVIDPVHTGTLYVGTYEQGIHKSEDCGASWKKINTGKNGDEIGRGRNWTMAIDPEEPETLYANSGYGPFGLFKSVNGGVDWVQLFPEDSEFARYADAFVETVAIDPTNHRHLVVHSHGECEGPVAGPTCYAESMDSGASWRLVKAHPSVGYEAVGTVILGGKTWLTFLPLGGIVLTQDAGATWRVAYAGAAANQTGTLYRHGDGNYYAASYNGVLKSPDGIAWTLLPNSPRSFTLAGDGTTIWTSVQDDNPETAYFAASGNLRSWKPFASPKMRRGSWFMKYDEGHGLLYTSNEHAGLWRVKTK